MFTKTQDNYSTIERGCVPVMDTLCDKDSRGKDKPWKEKKLRTIRLSESYKRIGMINKAYNVSTCGDSLHFKECKNDGFKKLIGANFCKNRLCPMCNWRRSRMLAKQIVEVLHEANKRKPMKYIFLTLTVKNCADTELSDTMDKLFSSFKRLFELKSVSDVVVGYVRVLEITHNTNKRSVSYDTYHPHFHVLMGVKPSYFKDKYIKHDTWVEMWKNALRADYSPSVDVKVVKSKLPGQDVEAAAQEAGKYSVKDEDYIVSDMSDTDRAVRCLDAALKGRRLIAYGKLFRQVKSDLKLKDVEGSDVDLVGNEDGKCNCPLCNSDLVDTLYKWHYGLNEYIKF